MGQLVLYRYVQALKFDHLPVIDTAMLFKYKNLPRSTPGLADLCKVGLYKSNAVDPEVESAWFCQPLKQ
jgi:hypothetical protein